jgi:hypothetical protein
VKVQLCSPTEIVEDDEADAAIIAAFELGDHSWLAERIPEAKTERGANYLIKIQRKRRSQRGRPPLPLTHRTRFVVAVTFLRLHVGDGAKYEQAVGQAAKEYGLSEGTIEAHLRFARNYDSGVYWLRAEKLARKRKRGIPRLTAVNSN